MKKNIDREVGTHVSEETSQATVFYIRDIKSKDQEALRAVKFANFEKFTFEASFEDYNYVFDETKSKWSIINTKSWKLTPLQGRIVRDIEYVTPEHRDDFFKIIEQKQAMKDAKNKTQKLKM